MQAAVFCHLLLPAHDEVNLDAVILNKLQFKHCTVLYHSLYNS